MSNRSEIVKQTEWPKRTEDVTADALILHSARLAMAAQADADRLMAPAFDTPKTDPGYLPAMRAYLDAVTAVVCEAQLAIALVTVQRRSRDYADELARVLYELTEDGGVLPELMYDYLNARGVDADEVWEVVKNESNQEVSA